MAPTALRGYPAGAGCHSLSSRDGWRPARGTPRGVPGVFGGPWAPGGEYSTEVPQQVRIRRDADTRSGTVTCGYGRGWTWCLLFASRGSGVRVPLAPQVRSKIRNPEPVFRANTAAKYSNRDCVRCRTRVRVGPSPSRSAAHRSQVLAPRFRAAEQEERPWEGPVPLAGGQQATCRICRFKAGFLPLIQRVSEWQPMGVTCSYAFS